VLYVHAGQTSENEIVQNREYSEEFEIFMEMMGSKVELEGFTGFRGGLDVHTNTTGTHSYYTTYKGWRRAAFYSAKLIACRP
jgi:hypothetical protein